MHTKNMVLAIFTGFGIFVATSIQGLKNNSRASVSQKVIILDLNEFISEDSSQIIRKIGFGKMASYALSHWKSPVDSCLDALEKVSSTEKRTSATTLIYKERSMPCCIVSWQQGECSYQEVKTNLISCFDTIERGGFFVSKKEREMAQAIIEIVFDPAQLGAISRSVPAMIKLARELKSNGYKIYAIGNMASDAYAHVKQAYPDVIALFDGVIVSSQARVLKSNKKLFEHLCDMYKLNPAHCTLINKDAGPVHGAQNAGMAVVHCSQQKSVRAALKKQGIL